MGNPVRLIDPDGRSPIVPNFWAIRAITQFINNPVGTTIAYNYNTSSKGYIEGGCYAACKSRFETAYKQVKGNSPYDDLPESSRSKYYGPRGTFDAIFNVAFGAHGGWKGIDKSVRGKGSAGAIANAGFGNLLSPEQIWGGELTAGAMMQAFRGQEAADAVEEGNEDPSISIGGHSFLFLSYQYGDDGEIIGLNIADQGYRTNINRTGDVYSVLFAANITVTLEDKKDEKGN